MSEYAASQAPGWYYAQGDPPGTQRYWDGSQWVGGPQAAQGAVAASGGYGQLAAPAGAPASWGSRFLAVIIDSLATGALMVVVYIVGFIGIQINDGLGTILLLVGSLAVLVFGIWNVYIRQGSTGQTIGKAQQNIKLVSDATGQPVGAGMAFVRYLVAGLLWLACLIPGILDLFWPAFDEERKRLTDKIVKMSVVDA